MRHMSESKTRNSPLWWEIPHFLLCSALDSHRRVGCPGPEFRAAFRPVAGATLGQAPICHDQCSSRLPFSRGFERRLGGEPLSYQDCLTANGPDRLIPAVEQCEG